jgi:endonuclease/exonuclease/phosphatase family metal-dependent hydrolase
MLQVPVFSLFMTMCVCTESNLKVWTQNMWSFEPDKNSSERREIEFANAVRSLPRDQQPDIICFQEMWAWGNRKWTRIKQILDEAGYNYLPAQYLESDRDNDSGYPGRKSEDLSGASGLAIAAKKEMTLKKMVHQPFDIANSDGKGVVYAKFEKDGTPIHVFNTHLSWKYDRHGIRKQEIEKIYKHYEAQNIPENEFVLFGGDFNMDYHKHKNVVYTTKDVNREEIRNEMEKADEPSMLEQSLHTKIPDIPAEAYTWDIMSDFVPDKGDPEDYNLYFDYILFPEKHTEFLKLATYRILRIQSFETFKFSTPENFSPEKDLKNCSDISDHYTLEVCVTFAREKETPLRCAPNGRMPLEKKLVYETTNTPHKIRASSKPHEKETETTKPCYIL